MEQLTFAVNEFQALELHVNQGGRVRVIQMKTGQLLQQLQALNR